MAPHAPMPVEEERRTTPTVSPMAFLRRVILIGDTVLFQATPSTGKPVPMVVRREARATTGATLATPGTTAPPLEL